tara:strand:- start:119 stop:424 length:306 start_codon:yes stop_codon:yes gene_type:complete
MRFLFVNFIGILFSFFLISCQTVSNKIDDKTIQEEQKLSKWLNKSESELKLAFGKPDKIEFKSSGNRQYIYATQKLKIKCERKFEINPNNEVIGFSSKNCF